MLRARAHLLLGYHQFLHPQSVLISSLCAGWPRQCREDFEQFSWLRWWKFSSRVSIVSPQEESSFNWENALKLADEFLFNYPGVSNEAGVWARKQAPGWARCNLWFRCIDSHTQAQPGVTHQLLSGHDLSSAVRSAVYTGSHVLIPKAQVTANPSKVQSFSHSIIAWRSI